MLLPATGANTFNTLQTSWGTTRPAAANGTSVTPGLNTNGSWTQIFTATSADSYGIWININSNTTNAASRATVLAIGIDPAGGSSYTEIVPNIICGNAAVYTTGGLWYYFPIFIKAGSTIAVRGNSTVATAFRVGAQLFQQPSRSEQVRIGSFARTFGVSGNVGTTIVPGTTSEGAWTSIGTTAEALWWWQIGFQVTTADTTQTTASIHLDLAVGDASNKRIVIQDQLFVTTTAESILNIPQTIGCEYDVPSGTNLYMRAQSSAALDTEYNCAVYGIGG